MENLHAEHLIPRAQRREGRRSRTQKGHAAYIAPGELHQPYYRSPNKTALVINSPPVTARTR